MKHLKLYESFGTQEEDIKKFFGVLDFPRQQEEGFLETEGIIEISSDIERKESAKRGLEAIEKDPGLLNSPLVKALFDEWMIRDIEIDRPNDVILVKYGWMTPQQWEEGNYDDTEYTYTEYLENFGVDMDPMWVKIQWP